MRHPNNVEGGGYAQLGVRSPPSHGEHIPKAVGQTLHRRTDRHQRNLERGPNGSLPHVELPTRVTAPEPSIHQVGEHHRIVRGAALVQAGLDARAPPWVGRVVVAELGRKAISRPGEEDVIVYRFRLYCYPLPRQVLGVLSRVRAADVGHQSHRVFRPPLRGLPPVAQEHPGDPLGTHPLPGHQAGQHRLPLAPPTGPLLGPGAKHPPILRMVLRHALDNLGVVPGVVV